MHPARAVRLLAITSLILSTACTGNINNSSSVLNMTILVSKTTSGIAADKDCVNPSMSTDGRYVAFESDAPNLVPSGFEENSPRKQIYVADLAQNTLTLITTNLFGTAIGNHDSTNARISGDGKYVAFQSGANNLYSYAQPLGFQEVYRFSVTDPNDRILVSTEAGYPYPAGAGGGATSGGLNPAISADGKIVVFGSDATNLVSSGTSAPSWDPQYNVFVRCVDPLSPTLLVSTIHGTSTEATGDSEPFNGLAISGDKTKIVFSSRAGDLLPPSQGGITWEWSYDTQLYMRTMTSFTTLANDTTILSPSLSQPPFSSGLSYHPAVSWDGRYVVFTSTAADLVPSDINGFLSTDIFLRDTTAGTTVMMSRNPVDGHQASNDSVNPGISADGRYVVFSSKAANLVEFDLNEMDDIFLFDRENDSLLRISVSSYGGGAFSVSGAGGSNRPFISGDGRFVAYDSSAPNLVVSDGNDKVDIFVSGPLH
jgi:Tol biopolymer transport system component